MTKSDPKFQKFRELCNQNGFAATVQRFVVFETLAGMHNHPTADMIYEMLHPENPSVSRMSVYRILETFARCRMIRRLNHPGSATHYDAFMEPHHHLICVQCGTVLDIPRSKDENFQIPMDNIPEGFEVLDVTIDFQGVCAACAAQNAKEENQEEKKLCKCA